MRSHDADFPVPRKLTAAGSRYELHTRQFLGRDSPMFRNAPRTLGALLTQPGAGSAASITTAALLEGVHCRVNGTKRIFTNAPRAKALLREAGLKV